ncbi:MAG: RNA-binding protein [Gammaproteobacteria bacterium]|nr:RNA-binding protein [Gammaproteobacteria bacterium]
MEQNQIPQNAPNTLSNAASQVDSQYKLYVGNIDYAATEAELAAYFAQFGEVEFVNIPVNRYTGKARGFGFVSFVSKEDAERAMSLHGAEFKGRQIQVNFAKERGETA